MIEYEKPSKKDFEAFIQLATDIYIDELVKHKEYSDKVAASLYAHHEIAGMLPHGQDTPDQFVYFARNQDGEIVGYLWYVIEPPHLTDKAQCFLAYLYVLPEYRQQGYGMQMMEGWEQLAISDHDMHFLYFYVFKSNTPAINLYLKQGYQTADQLNKPDWSTENRHLMVKLI